MVQEHLRGRSFLRIDFKAQAQEVIQVIRQVLRDGWVLLVCYFDESSPSVEVVVRRLLGQELDDSAAQTPNITGTRNLFLLLNDLWGHPVGRAREGHVVDGYLAVLI